MKLETFRQQVTNVYLETDNVAIDATIWHSLEGCNLLMTTRPDSSIRFAGSFTWAELDLMMTAINAVRSE